MSHQLPFWLNMYEKLINRSLGHKPVGSSEAPGGTSCEDVLVSRPGSDRWVMGSVFMTTSLSVSGYQAVSGGNQQVDQSAWGFAAVQGAGCQVSDGTQV